jgi:hypothetical protein
MVLNDAIFTFMKHDYTQSKRMRFWLAQLYGFKVEVDHRAFILQASEIEMDYWCELQQFFHDCKGKHERLKAFADKAYLEYSVEKSFEEGRFVAYQLSLETIVEQGQHLRYADNPYWQNSFYPQSVQQAWSDGFQNAFQIIAVQPW